jgi:hypothetical protein
LWRKPNGKSKKCSGIVVKTIRQTGCTDHFLTLKGLVYTENASTGGTGWNVVALVDYAYNPSHHMLDAVLSVDQSGFAHVLYRSGATTAGSTSLIYLTNAGGSWTSTQLHSGSDVRHLSMTVDSSDALHIAFVDHATGELWHGTKVSGTTSWSFSLIDGSANNAAISIAVDESDHIHVSYANAVNTLMYANNASGAWSTSAVASDSAINIGRTDIALTSEQGAHITYFDTVSSTVLYTSNIRGSWAAQSIVSATTTTEPEFASVIDSAGSFNLVFEDASSNTIFYANSVCGDGIVDVTEACDDADTSTSYTCSRCIAPDTDGDGVRDDIDEFPTDPAETTDTDGDGVGDHSDAFPTDSSETIDTDGDGVGDNSDVFPTDPTESVDTDGDGVGDNEDDLPYNPSETVDTDGDGYGNNYDTDDDGDCLSDSIDPNPSASNTWGFIDYRNGTGQLMEAPALQYSYIKGIYSNSPILSGIPDHHVAVTGVSCVGTAGNGTYSPSKTYRSTSPAKAWKYGIYIVHN